MSKSFHYQDQQSQTLAKGLMILNAFSERSRWGLRELARWLDLNPATVARLVATLENAGYLLKDSRTQQYTLGPGALKLGNLYAHHNPLPRLARRIFERYADRFAYNFYLGTLAHNEVVYLAAVDGRGPIKVVVLPGGVTGLHSTALGKVLLAFQDDAYIQRFLQANELKAYTRYSIIDPAQLWEQILQIRRDGFAVNAGEQYEDVGAIGVPVHDPRGQVVAGVSLAYPVFALQDGQLDLDELVPLAREIAAEISALYADHGLHLVPS